MDVPASNTPVESEFNKLKNFVINHSLRVDKFVEQHIKYLIRRVIIANNKISQGQIDVSTDLVSNLSANSNVTHILNETLNKSIENKSTIFDTTDDAELSISGNQWEEMQVEKNARKYKDY